MRYAKAAAFAIVVVILGGQVLRFVDPLSLPGQGVTLATFVLAALAARLALKR